MGGNVDHRCKTQYRQMNERDDIKTVVNRVRETPVGELGHRHEDIRRLCDELDPPPTLPDVRLPKYDATILAADYWDDEIAKLLDETVEHWNHAERMGCDDSDGFRVVVGMAFCRALAYDQQRSG